MGCKLCLLITWCCQIEVQAWESHENFEKPIKGKTNAKRRMEEEEEQRPISLLLRSTNYSKMTTESLNSNCWINRQHCLCEYSQCFTGMKGIDEEKVRDSQEPKEQIHFPSSTSCNAVLVLGRFKV